MNDFLRGPQHVPNLIVNRGSGIVSSTDGGILVDSADKQRMMEEKRKELYNQEVEDTENYNANIKNFDPLYEGLVATNGVLVRVFAPEMQKIEEGSLILDAPTDMIVGDTKAGVGKKTYENNYKQFSRKAIVVSSNVAQFQKGAIVQVSEEVIFPNPIPGTDMMYLQFGTTHYSASPVPPTKHCGGKERHFGYFLVPPHKIDFIVNE